MFNLVLRELFFFLWRRIISLEFTKPSGTVHSFDTAN